MQINRSDGLIILNKQLKTIIIHHIALLVWRHGVPSRVNDSYCKEVFKTMFPNIEQHMAPRLPKVDLVRVLQKRKLSDKGYKSARSKELYTVASVH